VDYERRKAHQNPSESSPPLIPPSVRTVFETSFVTIAAFQPFVGQLFVGYKVITAVYSVTKAYEERGLVGAASAVGKEAISASLASSQGTIAWNIIANHIDPKFRVVAKAFLEECVDGITNEEIDFVSSHLAR
jgi:hypothetical protein